MDVNNLKLQKLMILAAIAIISYIVAYIFNQKTKNSLCKEIHFVDRFKAK